MQMPVAPVIFEIGAWRTKSTLRAPTPKNVGAAGKMRDDGPESALSQAAVGE